VLLACLKQINKQRCCSQFYLFKNSLAVKKGAALFKMASVKKVMELKGAAKKWL